MFFNVQMRLQKMKEGRPTELVEGRFPILLPHVAFNWLYFHDHKRFKQVFLGSLSSVAARQAFWQEAERRDDPRLQDHPMIDRADWQKFAIPLAVHGDGVPCIKVGKAGTRSLDCFSCCGLAATGPTLAVKLVLYCMFLHSVVKEGEDLAIEMDATTMEQIGNKLLWSFHYLWLGVWPRCSWDDDVPLPQSMQQVAGRPLADGLYGVVYTIKCDLDYAAKDLHLQHYNSATPCEECSARRGIGVDRSHAFNNFSRTAKWPKEQRSVQQWLALYDGAPKHWLFSLAS